MTSPERDDNRFSSRTVISIVVVLAALGFMAWLWQKTEPPPPGLANDGLIDELRRQQPRLNFNGMCFLTPFDDSSKLGFRPRSGASAQGPLSTEALPCFAVQAEEAAGPSLESHIYRSTRALASEFGTAVTAKVAQSLEEGGSVELRLTAMRVRRGMGAPLPGGACNFEKTGQHQVVDAELLGDTEFYRIASRSGKGEVRLPSPAAQGGTRGDATEQSIHTAKNLVFAANVTSVRVDVATQAVPLGRSVAPQPVMLGDVYPGMGVDGIISVMAFDAPQRRFRIKVIGSPGLQAKPPAGFLPLSEATDIALGDSADFQLSRTVTLRVLPDYERPGSPEASRKLLRLTAYVTKYSQEAKRSDLPVIFAIDSPARQGALTDIRNALLARMPDEIRVEDKPTRKDWDKQCRELANDHPALVLVHWHALRPFYEEGHSLDQRERLAEQELLRGLRILKEASPATQIVLYSSAFAKQSERASRGALRSAASSLYGTDPTLERLYGDLIATVGIQPWSDSTQTQGNGIDSLALRVKQALGL